jgi:putative RNA 2'-phosphotransferase
MISKHLRHKPESIGLTLEDGGWVGVDALLEAFARKGFTLSRAELEEVVRRNDKQRFAFSQDGLKIRASQGHSVPVDLGLTPLEPPEMLYHGTTQAALESVLETGLKRMRRHHVHLSAEPHTAERVGNRHGTAVVLKINALEMHAAGHEFYRSDNGVWLTDEVPPQFIER